MSPGKPPNDEPETKKTTKAKEPRELLAFYEKVFSTLHAIVYIFDLTNLRLVWVNDGFKKILGFRKTKRKLPESLLLDIHHPDDRDVIREMKEFFLKNKRGTFTGIFRLLNSRGGYTWICTSSTVLNSNKKDSVLQIVGVSIDFSKDLIYNKNLKQVTTLKLKSNNNDVIQKLTKRELELMKMFASGQKSKDIAGLLNLSLHTVNNHRKNILKKLELRNLAALANFAVENGLN